MDIKFNLKIPKMEDISKIKFFFEKNSSEILSRKNKTELDQTLTKITKNSRNFLLNGKLELFIINFPKKEFLNYLNEFCDIENLNKILLASNFSLNLIEKKSKKV